MHKLIVECDAGTVALRAGDLAARQLLRHDNLRTVRQRILDCIKDGCDGLLACTSISGAKEFLEEVLTLSGAVCRTCKIGFAAVADRTNLGGPTGSEVLMLRAQASFAREIHKRVPSELSSLNHRLQRTTGGSGIDPLAQILRVLYAKIADHWAHETDEEEAAASLHFLLELIRRHESWRSTLILEAIRAVDASAPTARIAQAIKAAGKLPDHWFVRQELISSFAKAYARVASPTEIVRMAEAIS